MPATDAAIVLCARCYHPWWEDDDGVRYIPVMPGAYDWFCADETECDDRRYADAEAEGGDWDGS